jgi:GTP-binding protein HflX
LVSDTVGFIKNLPHNLIESFKSTLSEVVESDILLHVIDISNPNYKEQIGVVEKTLKEIGAGNKVIFNVFNKVDRIGDFDLFEKLKEEYKNAIFISARKGINTSSLINLIKEELIKDFSEKIIKLKKDDYKTLNDIYKTAEVKDVKYLKTCIKVTIKSNKKNLKHLEK